MLTALIILPALGAAALLAVRRELDGTSDRIDHPSTAVGAKTGVPAVAWRLKAVSRIWTNCPPVAPAPTSPYCAMMRPAWREAVPLALRGTFRAAWTTKCFPSAPKPRSGL